MASLWPKDHLTFGADLDKGILPRGDHYNSHTSLSIQESIKIPTLSPAKCLYCKSVLPNRSRKKCNCCLDYAL